MSAPTDELVDEARTARDEGLETATDAADPRVSLAIDAAIAEANAAGTPWSANDIREVFPVCSSGLVGARISAAVCRRPREMVKVGTTPSTLTNTHAKEIGVYVGLLSHGEPRSAAYAVLTHPAVQVVELPAPATGPGRRRPATKVDPTDVPLFDGYDDAVPAEELSADRRRTARQQADIAAGRHPLAQGPLHPDASRDRTRISGRDDALTCGTCTHRFHTGGAGVGYPKCDALGPAALSASAATDVRAWWPACPSYEASPE